MSYLAFHCDFSRWFLGCSPGGGAPLPIGGGAPRPGGYCVGAPAMLAPAAAAATVPLPCGVITWRQTRSCGHPKTDPRKPTPTPNNYLLRRSAHPSNRPGQPSWSLRHRSSRWDTATCSATHTRTPGHACQWDTSYSSLGGETGLLVCLHLPENSTRSTFRTT